MNNDYNEKLDDIKFLLVDIYDRQDIINDELNRQNKYLKNINNFVNLIIFIYVLSFIIKIGFIYIVVNYGIDIFKGIM